jgi:hypothetical protein
MDEQEEAIGTTKKSKVLGPGGTPIGFHKIVDDESKTLIL